MDRENREGDERPKGEGLRSFDKMLLIYSDYSRDIHELIRNVNYTLIRKYIVACQRGGVSNKPPWFRAATRQGPLTGGLNT